MYYWASRSVIPQRIAFSWNHFARGSHRCLCLTWNGSRLAHIEQIKMAKGIIMTHARNRVIEYFKWRTPLKNYRTGIIYRCTQRPQSFKTSCASLKRLPTMSSVNRSRFDAQLAPWTSRNSRTCCKCQRVWTPQSKWLGWKGTWNEVRNCPQGRINQYRPLYEGQTPTLMRVHSWEQYLCLYPAPRAQQTTLRPNLCQNQSPVLTHKDLQASGLYSSVEEQASRGWAGMY